MKCITCQQETSNPKFCSRSCAATYNNTGVRRHGEEPGNCIYCGQKKSGSDRKYCSQLCSSNAKLISPEQKRASNAARQSKYRAKKYRVLAENADIQKIKAAIEQIALEKKISKDKLVEIIEHAIKTAYKRDYASKST